MQKKAGLTPGKVSKRRWIVAAVEKTRFSPDFFLAYLHGKAF